MVLRKAILQSYAAEELVATKFRAILQRRKDRDLFDLGQCFDRLALDNRVILTCFQHYLGDTAPSFTRANVEEILLKKLAKNFIDDIRPLLPAQVNYGQDQALQAFKTLWLQLVVNLPGDPWKNTARAINQYHDRYQANSLAELLDAASCHS